MQNGNSEKTIVVTIDGPAGAGKSTIAKKLAKRLNFAYLDTGAMYRALTFKALRAGIELDNEDHIVELARTTIIDLKDDPATGLTVYLDGDDVSADIRTQDVTNHTHYIARAPRVREIMVQWQRGIGRKCNTVIEGRDIGTVVFPDAEKKFYLDADFDERARRRIQELRDKGKAVDDDQVSGDLKDRDNKDFTREVGPLKKADDARLIDSTHLSIDEVVDMIYGYVQDNRQ